MSDSGLKGKVAVVTGAQHGIGAAAAEALARQGAAVFVHYFRLSPSQSPGAAEKTDTPGQALYQANQARSGEEVVRGIRDAGGRAEAWEADLAGPRAASALFDRAEQRLGPVHILVNNAAHWEPDGFLPEGERTSQTVSLRTFDRHFAVNTRAAVLLMEEFARRHARHNLNCGRIINISTDAASCFPGEVSYGASKAALEAYSRSAAWELGRLNITVNVVAPGPTQTGWISSELEKQLLPSIPLGRLGHPEDIADVIVFLASEQGRWLTGQVLYVGGKNRM